MASSRVRGDGQLNRLRVQLTAWYALTFAIILLLLGGGLFLQLQQQFSNQLDDSLRDAVSELEGAATIRGMDERASGHGAAAVDALRIPDRYLYLLDTSGHPLRPDTASRWIRKAAVRAAAGSATFAEAVVAPEVTFKLYAKRFSLRSGTTLVAVAVADKVEMEDKYADLITAFSAAAVFALILVASGGWLLMRKSTAPIERSIAHMRRFMADAAHELRTPISVARTRAEVALEKPRDPASYQASLRGIAAETQRIGKIVENLLTLSRADAGDAPVDRRLIYLDDVVVEAAQAARFLAAPRNIDLRVDKFEEAQILADAELVRQLVLILLDNAIKFSPAGSSVSVCVGMVNGYAEVEVEDRGPGIPAEQLPHIFERFFKGDIARTKGGPGEASGSGEGAGLGLSIAQWIAESQNAQISVVSSPGEGARFKVRFPAAGG